MFFRIILIAMTFVGLIVGAGFSSGQEITQYFVSFGINGVWGAIIAGLLMTAAGLSVFQLGSYFQAKEHTSVLTRITNKPVAMILDASVMLTLFCTGIVMIAGAGSNLNQQFGFQHWIGAVLMYVLVLAAGMLDIDKLSAVIGSITPVLIIFILLASIYSLVTMDAPFSESASYAAAHVDTALPHWLISPFNYIGMNLMVGVSMAFIIGGNHFSTREAALGGLLGGLIYGIMLTLCTVALIITIRDGEHQDMPLLSLVDNIHPTLGFIMALAIYGMIFNTAIGMFYAIAKRVTVNRPELFRTMFILSTTIGFGLSFFGFKTLVANVYPILGYLGILLIVVVIMTSFRGHEKLRKESRRRIRILDLERRKRDPETPFTKKHNRELIKLRRASNMKNKDITHAVQETLDDELDSSSS